MCMALFHRYICTIAYGTIPYSYDSRLFVSVMIGLPVPQYLCYV